MYRVCKSSDIPKRINFSVELLEHCRGKAYLAFAQKLYTLTAGFSYPLCHSVLQLKLGLCWVYTSDMILSA